MSDPVEPQLGIEATTDELMSVTDAMSEAHRIFNAVEMEWDAHRDLIYEELKDQMVEEGRKGDPADHYVISVARRRKPELYAQYRRAERAIKLAETKSKNLRSALTGYQSRLRSEHALVGPQASDRRGLPQHLQRRVA